MEPEPPPKKPPFASMRQLAIVGELPFALVGPVLIGSIGGLLLDRWLGTAPFLVLALGAIGFYAGVREAMRRFKQLEKASDDKTRE